MNDTKRICGAKTRSGTPCQKSPMTNGRCRLHGGLSLAGAASPTFRTGRYSKYLPTRLAARFQEAQADPELLGLRDEIALIDARLAELVQRLNAGESSLLWSKLKETHDELVQATQARDAVKIAGLMQTIASIIESGSRDGDMWAEIFTVVNQRARIVESERKRLVENQQMISSERAMILMAAVVDTIRKHVTDPATLTAIAVDIRRLTVASADPS